jgi:hypothetical protein
VRFSIAIREAFDQVYDGQHTGRWDYTQLMKTEKTHIGTLVEMWLQREFAFDDGEELDYTTRSAVRTSTRNGRAISTSGRSRLRCTREVTSSP